MSKKYSYTLPPHRKDTPNMLDLTKFTNNSFLSFLPLLSIHWSCPASYNISNLSHKALVDLF